MSNYDDISLAQKRRVIACDALFAAQRRYDNAKEDHERATEFLNAAQQEYNRATDGVIGAYHTAYWDAESRCAATEPANPPT